MRRFVLLILLGLLAVPAFATEDPLPSWNPTPVKQAIVDFVAAVTTPDSPDFLPVAERVAVFDNDGTFLCERPRNPSSRFQVHMLQRQVEAGRVDPESMPTRAWLANDRQALRDFGYKQAYFEMNRAFAGLPVQAFRDSARAFVDRSRHPRYGVPYTRLYYAPMLELSRWLTEKEFQVWVVTGSEQEFMRSFLEDATGVPPERVIGSWTRSVARVQDGQVHLVRGDTQIYNGHEAKAANIETRIGRRPVLAIGNSNNDQPMCRWTVTRPGRSLALWIHHDDQAREYSYDRSTDEMRELVQERANAWEVSIQRDWGRIFPQP